MLIRRADDFVRLTVYSPDYGDFFQQLLQTEGIESQVVGDSLFPGLPGVPVSPELWVRSSDLERAVTILENHRATAQPEDRDESEEDSEVGSRKKPLWILMGILGVLSIGVIIAAVVATCVFGWDRTKQNPKPPPPAPTFLGQ